MGESILRNKGYTCSDMELAEIRQVQIDMLVEVDRICKKYDIKYCIIGGTLLGCIRHGGYIPWDDDADLGMLREEYEKFKKACKQELNEDKFCFQDHQTTKGYRWGYGKLRRKDTKFIRLNQEDMPYFQGIFIDIFPYDNVPENFFLRLVHCFICFVYRKCFWSAVGYKFEKNLLIKTIYKLLYQINEEKLKHSFNRFIRYSNRRKTKFVRVLTFPNPKTYRTRCEKRYWYEHLKRYEFEGVKLVGIADADEYLRYKYGDYMKIPDEKDRMIHPISELKLPDRQY